jgi:hypothetical protein
MTPEGRVKKMVSSYLKELDNHLTVHGQELYYSMFVPSGYGKNNMLDYTICLAGHYVAIETKAPGEWLNAQQRLTCRSLYRAGATVFIISRGEGLDAFKRWVERTAPAWRTALPDNT